VTLWMKSGTSYQPSHRRSRPHQAIRALRSISRARKERYATVAFSYAECYWMTRPTWEFVMMKLRDAAIVGVASIALATAPINPAFARWHGGWHGGPIFWPFALGAAVVAGAAIVATAPLRVLAAPAYAPPPAYYPPPPAYYPPPGYYAPPPGYYGR